MSEEYNIDDIQALSFPEAVRKRPQLYFAKCFDEKSLDALPLEACCHAIDEYYDGNCRHIQISLEADSFNVRYDAGMALEDSYGYGTCPAVSIMTGVFACRNEKKHLSVGEEFCELGIATINAATETCELVTVYQGKKGSFKFEKGEMVSHTIESCNEESDHSHIFMSIDKTVFGNIPLTYNGVLGKVEQIMAKLSGLKITVSDSTNA